MAENEPGQNTQALTATAATDRAADFEVRLRDLIARACKYLQHLQESLPPEVRSIFSAGRVLFQILGVAGFAGYFSGMHSLMRVVSIGLVSIAWYGIYWIRKELAAERS